MPKVMLNYSPEVRSKINEASLFSEESLFETVEEALDEVSRECGGDLRKLAMHAFNWHDLELVAIGETDDVTEGFDMDIYIDICVYETVTMTEGPWKGAEVQMPTPFSVINPPKGTLH